MTPNEARDQVLSIFASVWAIQGHTAIYEHIPAQPPISGTWARAQIEWAGGEQAAFGSGVRKYGNGGIVAIQIFTPLGDGGTTALTLAQLLLVAYSQARKEVWFTKPRIRSAPQSGAFHQINFYVDFNYDDHR